MTALRPFMSYYGGKWRAAPRYPAPDCDVIVEPFAGSAGYAVRHHTRRVLLFDLDEKVIATWRYLISASERDIRALPLLGPTDDVRELPISQEARWLIGWWLNKGVAAPRNRPSHWMRHPFDGSAANYWGEAVRERLAQQVSAIRHWRAEVGSYESAPDIDATWFIDPPYSEGAGAHYTHSSAAINYSHLADWCRARRGQVIVCENVGAGWLSFEPFMVAQTTVGRGRARVSKEAIWLGGAL